MVSHVLLTCAIIVRLNICYDPRVHVPVQMKRSAAYFKSQAELEEMYVLV